MSLQDNPYALFVHENQWRAILHKLDNFSYPEINEKWTNMSEKQRINYAKKVQHIKNLDQLDNYLSNIKNRIFKQCKHKRELLKLQDGIKKKNIQKKKGQ